MGIKGNRGEGGRTAHKTYESLGFADFAVFRQGESDAWRGEAGGKRAAHGITTMAVTGVTLNCGGRMPKMEIAGVRSRYVSA